MYKRYDTFYAGLFTGLVNGIKQTSKEVSETHRVEAEENGLELLTRTNRPGYNFYKFKECGHKRYLQATHVRRGNVKCNTCKVEQMIKLCREKGIHLLYIIGDGKGLALNKCGHLVTVYNKHNNTFYCKICYEQKLKDSCNGDYSYVGTKGEEIGPYRYVKCNTCGTEKKVQLIQLKKKNVVCRKCAEEVYKQQALDAGLVLNGKCSDNVVDIDKKRNYTLPCGHVKDIRLDHVRNMRFECSECEESSYSKPSTVYLLKITTPEFECLKFGYTRNVKTRIHVYCLRDAVASEIISVPFKTGHEAHAFEVNIHRKYKDKRLNKNLMKNYMRNGGTECYPMEMKDVLIAEINKKVGECCE